RCVRTSTFSGQAAWAQREDLLGTPTAERRRKATGSLQETFDKLRLVSLTLGDSNDPDKPLKVTTEFEIDDLFAGDKGLTGQLIDTGGYMRLANSHIDPERDVALEIGEPFVSVQRFTVEAPPAFRFEIEPSDQQAKSEWGSFRRVIKARGKSPRKVE